MKLSVVVLNWNGKRYLDGIFSSLRKQTFRDFEAIMVDDGSTDGSAGYVRNRFPEVKVIVNARNMGVAAATNSGFRQALGKYIVLTINDMVLDKNCLKELVSYMDKNDAATAEGEVYNRGAGVVNGSLNVICDNIVDVFDSTEEKFYVCGGLLIIRNGLFREYYDSDYLYYQEDVYIGWRARLNGFQVKRAVKAKCLHINAKTITSARGIRANVFINERNKLLNFFTFYEGKNVAKLLPLLLAFNLFWLANYFRTPRKALYKLSAYAWIATHFGLVLRKRKAMQSERRVRDSAIFPYMSSRVVPDQYGFSRRVNRLALAYCRLMGINACETPGGREYIKSQANSCR